MEGAGSRWYAQATASIALALFGIFIALRDWLCCGSYGGCAADVGLLALVVCASVVAAAVAASARCAMCVSLVLSRLCTASLPPRFVVITASINVFLATLQCFYFYCHL